MKELLSSPATLRVLLYMLLPLLATVPGINVDQATGLITVDPAEVWPWLVGGLLAGGGVFAMWGKK